MTRFWEKFTGVSKRALKAAIELVSEREYPARDKVKGIFQDEIIYPDGRREIREWECNLIVNKFSELLAALCKGQAGFGGIQYWEVGTGDPAWDAGGPPAPTVDQAALVNALARKPVTITFLDVLNAPTVPVTNKIEVSVTFNVGEANGALRTFGVFGGTATTTLGSGYMVDAVNHLVINKPAGEGDFTLNRKLRITL
ncbi:MAG: hypothetical protein ACYCX4_11070 [Bacillota bacterium]